MAMFHLIRRRALSLGKIFSVIGFLATCYIVFLVTLNASSHKQEPKLVFMALDEQSETTEFTDSKCVLPKVDPYRQEILPLMKKLLPLKCGGRRYGYAEGREIHLKTKELKAAKMYYIKRPVGDDFKVTLSKEEVIDLNLNGQKEVVVIKPTEDFVKLVLTTHKWKTVNELHAIVQPKDDVIQSAQPVSTDGNSLGFNVAFLMLDSVSAATFERVMHRSKRMLRNQAGTVFFNGHTIVGDGTTAQLCAMFTGLNEQQLPEARRNFPGSVPVDAWPFIFKEFKKQGYATMFLEDSPNDASFNYRLRGFKNPPTDHYGRPFFIEARDEDPKNFGARASCYGSWPAHNYSLSYTMSFYNQYKHVKKFSLSVMARLSHNSINDVQLMDEDLTNFLKAFKEQGHFDNTIVIVFGDHGPRISGTRSSVQGKLEERLPFLSMTFPSSFKMRFKQYFKALQSNTAILTSHFDIYATLKHILSYPVTPKLQTGISLFENIDPDKRNCKTAGVADHWCPCLGYVSIAANDPVIAQLAQKAVEYINELIRANDVAQLSCAELTLGSMIRAGKIAHNWKMEKFKQTQKNSRCDSCLLVFEEKSLSKPSSYELVFTVQPSGGMFEVTVKLIGNSIKVDPNISRINRYGDQPNCIADIYPHLRKYCYCIT